MERTLLFLDSPIEEVLWANTLFGFKRLHTLLDSNFNRVEEMPVYIRQLYEDFWLPNITQIITAYNRNRGKLTVNQTRHFRGIEPEFKDLVEFANGGEVGEYFWRLKKWIKEVAESTINTITSFVIKTPSAYVNNSKKLLKSAKKFLNKIEKYWKIWHTLEYDVAKANLEIIKERVEYYTNMNSDFSYMPQSFLENNPMVLSKSQKSKLTKLEEELDPRNKSMFDDIYSFFAPEKTITKL